MDRRATDRRTPLAERLVERLKEIRSASEIDSPGRLISREEARELLRWHRKIGAFNPSLTYELFRRLGVIDGPPRRRRTDELPSMSELEKLSR